MLDVFMLKVVFVSFYQVDDFFVFSAATPQGTGLHYQCNEPQFRAKTFP